MKNINYFFEAAVLWLAFSIFRLMKPEMASDCGGWVGRTVGPRLAASRKALANLDNAMPENTEAQNEAIVRGMWDNLGRVIAEYPHLKDIIMNRTEVVGAEHLTGIGKDNPCIIIGGHIANWELLPFYFNYKADWPVAGIYRAPNNPYAEKLLDQCRNPEERGIYVPKSRTGTRALVKTLIDGGRILVLIDQKYNQGLAVPFFGRPAMTSPAFAQLAEKYDCPILPLRVERLDGCNFRITIEAPFKTEGREEFATIEHTHGILERWIREKPEQWLWLHRRWKSKALEQ